MTYRAVQQAYRSWIVVVTVLALLKVNSAPWGPLLCVPQLANELLCGILCQI